MRNDLHGFELLAALGMLRDKKKSSCRAQPFATLGES